MNETEWSGTGKWLSMAGAAMMFMVGIPLIFAGSGGQALAGWNIFLGLLIFGSLASNHQSASKIVLGVAILNIIRTLLSLAVMVAEQNPTLLFDFILNALVAIILLFGGLDLRRQR